MCVNIRKLLNSCNEFNKPSLKKYLQTVELAIEFLQITPLALTLVNSVQPFSALSFFQKIIAELVLTPEFGQNWFPDYSLAPLHNSVFSGRTENRSPGEQITNSKIGTVDQKLNSILIGWN